MKIILTSIFLLILLFGCTQPTASEQTIKNETISGEPPIVEPETPKENVSIIPKDGVYKYQGLPCDPKDSYGTITILGLEVKEFLGKKYEFCHTKTRMNPPPQSGTGTPALIGQDTWSYLNLDSPDIQIIGYDYVLYTDEYHQGGPTYQKKNGAYCESYVYESAPKKMEEYVETDFTCTNP